MPTSGNLMDGWDFVALNWSCVARNVDEGATIVMPKPGVAIIVLCLDMEWLRRERGGGRDLLSRIPQPPSLPLQAGRVIQSDGEDEP